MQAWAVDSDIAYKPFSSCLFTTSQVNKVVPGANEKASLSRIHFLNVICNASKPQLPIHKALQFLLWFPSCFIALTQSTDGMLAPI